MFHEGGGVILLKMLMLVSFSLTPVTWKVFSLRDAELASAPESEVWHMRLKKMIHQFVDGGVDGRG